MPRRMLTDRFCAHVKAREGEAQTDYFDESVAGLALRVSRGGKKSWTYHLTRGGKRVRITLGTYPATSLGSARTQVESARTALEEGKDPRTVLRKLDTLKAICEEYFEREGSGLRTKDHRKATLERLVYPQLGDHPIHEVLRSDVVRLFDRIEKESGPVMADQTLAYLRRVFSWYALRSDEFRSPIVRGMSRTKPRERARERILKDEELRIVWNVAEKQATVFSRLVRFILLTAARRSEAAEIEWNEINQTDWTLPAARNKTKVDLVRPLSHPSLAILPKKGEDAKFIFSGDGGETPIRGFSKFKREFDEAVEAEAEEPLPNWTLHDLRRTARSLMSRAGIPSDHAERCLGHVITGVRATYDRYDFHDEKERAFEALAEIIDRIVNPQNNVVRMRAEANG